MCARPLPVARPIQAVSREPPHWEHQLAAGDDVLQPGATVMERPMSEQSCWSEIAGSCQALETGRAGRATGTRPASTARISSLVAGFTT
jgi:hypothetical protein